MRPSRSELSESSSVRTPRSSSTTAGPSTRYTDRPKAERRGSFESISLRRSVALPGPAVAHHPRRERRRWAKHRPRVLRRAGLGDVKARTSRHLSAPKRVADVAASPRPSRRSWRPDPAATNLSVFSEVTGPLPVHVFLWILRSHGARPRCVRSGKRGAGPAASASSRRSWRAHNPGGRRQSSRPGRPGHPTVAVAKASPARGRRDDRSSSNAIRGVARLGAGATAEFGRMRSPQPSQPTLARGTRSRQDRRAPAGAARSVRLSIGYRAPSPPRVVSMGRRG